MSSAVSLPCSSKLAVSFSPVLSLSAKAEAKLFATAHNLALFPTDTPQLLERYPFALHFAPDIVSIVQTGSKAPGPVFANFITGGAEHRRKHGGGKGQLLAKAVGLNKKSDIAILDATAGLGKDSFVCASLGCQVTMLERSPVVAQLLRSALKQARGASIDDILARMNLVEADGASWLSGQIKTVADVIYLDPMYPSREKSALVKKEMRVFKELVGEDLDDAALLTAAIPKAVNRVVVKRPRKGSQIEGPDPTYVLSGKTTRYDIYVNKAFD